MNIKPIFVSPETHKKLKILAVKNGLTFEQLFIKFIENHSFLETGDVEV